ncbi:MAG TPA: hypothetical protein VD815_10690 [Candidatus Saccharimonadales bacterium]|nr:hypothetical protein [Candidatus Saccharimonadales bacterium]
MDDSITIDFKVIKEYWDSYLLSDDTKLKSRVVLTGVKKSKTNPSGEYEFDFQSIQSFVFSDKAKGKPHSKIHSKEELESSPNKEITHSIISERWNEYLLDDDTKVRLKNSVAGISKSDLCLQNGDPIYNVKIRVLSKVKRPNK